MAAIAIDEIIVARTGLVTSRPTRGRSYFPKGQYRARRSGVRIAPTKVVCGRFAINRQTGGDGVMIIIAWLIVVLMTPVDAAAHAPSPVANIAPACNLGGSSADDATYRSLRVFPERFRENPRWHMTHRGMKMAL